MTEPIRTERQLLALRYLVRFGPSTTDEVGVLLGGLATKRVLAMMLSLERKGLVERRPLRGGFAMSCRPFEALQPEASRAIAVGVVVSNGWQPTPLMTVMLGALAALEGGQGSTRSVRSALYELEGKFRPPEQVRAYLERLALRGAVDANLDGFPAVFTVTEIGLAWLEAE